MRLLPFFTTSNAGRAVHLGALADGDADDGLLIDLTAATRALVAGKGAGTDAARRIAAALVPPAVVDFIAGGPVTLDTAGEALQAAVDTGRETDPIGAAIRYSTGSIERLPAVPDAPLLRDFMGFEQHLANIYPRLGRTIPPEWYELPAYYKGNTAALGAHGADIAVPAYADRLDIEFEVAAVIGPGGQDIAEEDALEHVFGWTVYDDFSARAIQSKEMAVGLGPAKGKDFIAGHVLGPMLVTADEIPDPYAMRLEARVNGEVWTQGSTGDMHWRFEQMIAHASRGEIVRTGEIFGSGTVAGGSGSEQDRTLDPGDVIELEVDVIGVLRNRIVAAQR